MLRSRTYRARGLRRSATPAEQALWNALRERRLAGIKFRRQQPLGPFIVDFFSEEARLVIEVDGKHHFPRPQRDRTRDRFLSAAGLTVLRFPNREILEHLERVLARIRARLSPLSPRERGRG